MKRWFLPLVCLVILSSTSGVAKGLLITGLHASEEVPGPGDDDGSGFIVLKLKPNKGKICYFLAVDDIAEPTAAHIHKAPKGAAGPVVVPLAVDGDVSHGCVEDLDENLVRDISKYPEQYYVNVHNAEFPSGALRGQLGEDD